MTVTVVAMAFPKTVSHISVISIVRIRCLSDSDSTTHVQVRSGMGTYAGAARRRVHLATVLLRLPSGHRPGRHQARHARIIQIGLRVLKRLEFKPFLANFLKFQLQLRLKHYYTSLTLSPENPSFTPGLESLAQGHKIQIMEYNFLIHL